MGRAAGRRRGLRQRLRSACCRRCSSPSDISSARRRDDPAVVRARVPHQPAARGKPADIRARRTNSSKRASPSARTSADSAMNQLRQANSSAATSACARPHARAQPALFRFRAARSWSSRRENRRARCSGSISTTSSRSTTSTGTQKVGDDCLRASHGCLVARAPRRTWCATAARSSSRSSPTPLQDGHGSPNASARRCASCASIPRAWA